MLTKIFLPEFFFLEDEKLSQLIQVLYRLGE